MARATNNGRKLTIKKQEDPEPKPIRVDPDWYSKAFVVGQRMTITFHPDQWEHVQQQWSAKGQTLQIAKQGQVPINHQ